jgi:hypothetical protein
MQPRPITPPGLRHYTSNARLPCMSSPTTRLSFHPRHHERGFVLPQEVIRAVPTQTGQWPGSVTDKPLLEGTMKFCAEPHTVAYNGRSPAPCLEFNNHYEKYNELLIDYALSYLPYHVHDFMHPPFTFRISTRSFSRCLDEEDGLPIPRTCH